jgi:rsbT co-antagonist protein RsbR
MRIAPSPASSLNFRMRLILSLGFLSLLVAAIAATALLGLISLRESARQAAADTESSRLASEVVLNALLCRRYEKDFFLNAGDLAAQDAPLQKWNDASIALRVAIKGFEDAATTDGDRQQAQAWRDAWSDYTHGFGRVEIAINTGQIKTPKDALETFEPFQSNIQAMTDQAVLLAKQKTASARQTSLAVDTVGINTIWLVALIAGAVFVASIAWSLLFPAWLARPITVLHEAATRLANGDLAARAALNRQDELGALAQSFDRMAETVQRNTADLQAQYAEARDARAQAEEARRKIAGQLAMIEEQRAVISEMSVPILPLSETTLILPLIGALDSARLAHVRDRALQSVEQARARHLILDITGVPIVDTQVAQGLMQVVQAAQLLGCKVVLVGIRPEVAQAIVGLGFDLKGVETQSTLQSGIARTFGQSRSADRR